jgi:hypothetical protein
VEFLLKIYASLRKKFPKLQIKWEQRLRTRIAKGILWIIKLWIIKEKVVDGENISEFVNENCYFYSWVEIYTELRKGVLPSIDEKIYKDEKLFKIWTRAMLHYEEICLRCIGRDTPTEAIKKAIEELVNMQEKLDEISLEQLKNWLYERD